MSGPDMPANATPRIRQLVSLTISDERSASADENAWTAKPNCRSKSGSDSRTDSSSSTTDTSERLLITRPSSRVAFTSICASPDRGCATLPATVHKTLVLPRYAAGLATTHVPRASCCLKRNGKRERGAWSIVGLGPQPTVMSLDDRAADEQPDAHATAL